MKRAIYFCRQCHKGAVIDKGSDLGVCECGAINWRAEDDDASETTRTPEPPPYTLSVQDKQFLKQNRIRPD